MTSSCPGRVNQTRIPWIVLGVVLTSAAGCIHSQATRPQPEVTRIHLSRLKQIPTGTYRVAERQLVGEIATEASADATKMELRIIEDRLVFDYGPSVQSAFTLTESGCLDGGSLGFITPYRSNGRLLLHCTFCYHVFTLVPDKSIAAPEYPAPGSPDAGSVW